MAKIGELWHDLLNLVFRIGEKQTPRSRLDEQLKKLDEKREEEPELRRGLYKAIQKNAQELYNANPLPQLQKFLDHTTALISMVPPVTADTKASSQELRKEWQQLARTIQHYKTFWKKIAEAATYEEMVPTGKPTLREKTQRKFLNKDIVKNIRTIHSFLIEARNSLQRDLETTRQATELLQQRLALERAA